jgi:hexosaminidase
MENVMPFSECRRRPRPHVAPRHLVRSFVGLLLLACASTAAAPAVAQPTEPDPLDLMPVPASVQRLEGSFSLGETLSVAVVGPASERIEGALERLVSRLAARTGTPLHLERVDEARRALVVIECAQVPPGPLPSLEDDESYRLSVAPGKITLESVGPVGVLRGLATLAQLPAREGGAWVLPAVEISDAPRFPWRGLMIDVVRHWQPMEVIERHLDAMEVVKLNVLHLHASDDQAFRVESHTHPRLHEIGSGGDYYTQDEIRALVEQAADRGIRVVPEFDVPGHVTSWLAAYPELGSSEAEAPELPRPGGGLFPYALDPTREETYEFLDGLFGEMADLFPDPYFHVGGDEVSGDSWRSDERIQQFMDENDIEGTKGLQGHFTSRVLRIVSDHGKVGVGWDSILGGELPAGTVAQVWLPGVDPGQARSLVSAGFYLDHMLHAGKHYTNEPLDHLPEASHAGLLGGEACIWGEAIDSSTIDSRIWPRAGAIAERLWSPREVRDVEDMYRRLDVLRTDLGSLGLRHDSYYEPALARLTGGELHSPLKVLADVCEAPSLLGRILSIQVMGSMLAPPALRGLFQPPDVGTRFEDVLQPESGLGAAFGKTVDGYLASPDTGPRRHIEDQLGVWQANHEQVRGLSREFPGLSEIEPVSEGLASLASIGLAALGVLDGGRPFSPREKRLHIELLALHEPVEMDPGEIDLPEGEDLADVIPGIIVGRLVDKLKTLEPLIKFRVKIAVQPGIEALVLAAHDRGTRDEGPMGLLWFVYDHKKTIVFVVAMIGLVWLVRRRRRTLYSSPTVARIGPSD